MKRIFKIGTQVVLGVSLLVGATTGAQATTIVNDNVYQTPFISLNEDYGGLYADRLTDWLGKGSLTLTNIFDQVSYDDQHYVDTGRTVIPAEIDAAVAGKGPTFTILYASSLNTQNASVIGWYNPTNGVTAVGGNADETSRDSFIFNLTTDRVLRPVNDPVVSNIKADRDLSLNENFPAYGNIRINSYVDSFQGKGVLWDPAFSYSSGTGQFTYYFLEVYSISVDALAPVSAVPEPASWAMLLLGFGIVGGAARYRRRQAGAAVSQYRFA